MLSGSLITLNLVSGRVLKVTHLPCCSPSDLEPGEVFIPGNPDIQPGDVLLEHQRPAGQLLWLIARLTRSGGEAPVDAILPWAPFWRKDVLRASLTWLESVGLIKCRLAEDGFRFYSLEKNHGR